ncbi:MAG: hypothetical protein ACPKM0_00880 [Pleomorphochaeta sp.]
MKKKLYILLFILFAFSFNLYSGIHSIQLQGYVPETIQIKVENSENYEINLKNNLAYYQITNEIGIETTINEGYYLKVYMI